MRYLVTSFVALILLSGSLATFAATSQVKRNIQFSHLTTDEGLSAEHVNDIVQDGQGYIWFATQAGLNRFDGYEIMVFEHDPNDPTSLSDNFIRSLYIDDQERLWAATHRGVNRYDPDTQTFERNPLGLPADLVLMVRSIVQDSSGVFWLGTVDQGLYGIDPTTGEIRHYLEDASRNDSLPHNHIMGLVEDRKGHLWIGTDGGGLARYDRATDSFVTYSHTPALASSLSNDEVRSVFEDRAGNLWVGTEGGGLNLFDATSGTFKHFKHDPEDENSLAFGQVSAIFEDRSGTLWIGTENGISEWRPSMQGFVRYQNRASDVASLINDRVNTIFQDASGVLWVGTYSGVSRWNYFSDTFTQYRAEQGFLASDIVTSIAESLDGILWVGTYGGGLTRLDLAANDVRHFRQDPNDEIPLSDDRVMVVELDKQGHVWVGTRNGGVNVLTENGLLQVYRHDPEDPSSLSVDAITSIFDDADGGVWIGGFDGGLNYLAPNSDGKFEHFQHDPADASTLGGDRVLTIHRDTLGILWVGTEGGGINRFVEEDRSFKRFPVSTGAELGIVWDLVETTDGTLWMSTPDGLISWDAASRRAGVPNYSRYGKAEGLSPNIFAAVVGGMGEIWASSSRGLFRLDTLTGSVRRFDRQNGLRGTEFNQGARLRSRNGRLWFGSTQGLLGFFPGEIPRNDLPPRIRLTASSRKAEYTKLSSGEPAPLVQLDYLDPYISFDFVALDFVSPDKNQYRYRLNGFDDEWITEDRFRRAIYTNLPAGDYHFEVQGSNNDGVWNNEKAVIDVTVIPPPWQRTWAYFSYVALLIALVGWFVRRQKLAKRLEIERREALETQVKERTKELAERNTDLQALNDKLAEASVTDSLTGLRNRRYVDQFISSQISLVKRRHVEGSTAEGQADPDSSKLLFFMMIDLDGFKFINDTYGHHAGDLVLVQVKEVLLECVRESDVVVRWGGDEFMIIGHASSFAGVKILAERVRESLAEREYDVGRDDARGRISGSIGVAPFPFSSEILASISWEQVAAIADKGAYVAKSNGRNAWVSIRGTDRMEVSDFEIGSFDIEKLMLQEKLLIDSGLEGELDLSGGSTARYGAAAG